MHLSKDVALEEIKKPTRVVDVLIRYEYAGYHPEKEQKSDHLLLQRNRFGRCLVALTHELKRQALSRVKVENFYKIDNLGVECTPPCGSCRCGKCHLGTKDYNLKEEMEIQNQLQVGSRRCYAGQYFVLADLPDNRRAAFRMLREKAYQKAQTCQSVSRTDT